MAGVNKVILIGNLGKDPEVRHLDNGASVANFSIATTETYKDRNSGERVDQTEWHNIVLWRGLAEIAEKYLKKGDSVYIEGKLRTRSWEKDGVTRYTTEVVGDQMTMLGGKKSGDDSGQSSNYAGNPSNNQTASAPSQTPDTNSEMDDLPF
jgi:single-strand DNA-binding protein